ncbi:MAG TPA: lytic transglycosylase domain-containing protein [bacterium]|nr:lytic transglycosylase domain-containing protein [bacterium]
MENSDRTQKMKTIQKTKARKPKKIKKYKINMKWFGVATGILILILIATAAYLFHLETIARMEKVDRELVGLRSAMNTDSVRQHKLQKIMEIARRKNPRLNSMEAYDIASEIYEMDIRYSNLDIDLICALITHESANTWRPDIVSPAGAMGLMQIMPVTGMFLAEYEKIAWMTPAEVLFNPVYNIRMGCRLLSVLIDQYGLDGALAAYNAGERHASRWLANNKDDSYLWAETRSYIPAILALYDKYMSQSL